MHARRQDKKEEKERTRKESNNVLRSFRGRGKGVGGEEREKVRGHTTKEKRTEKIIKIAERRYSSKKTVFGKAKK